MKKRLPQAVGLSSDSSDGLSTPTSSERSCSSSALSAATTCPNSPDGGSDDSDSPDMRIGLDELHIFDDLRKSEPGAAITPRTKSSLDFLDRLEQAERRDQDTLRVARDQGVRLTPRDRPAPRVNGAAASDGAPAAAPPAARSLPGRSPRDSPRGGEGLKRRNTRCGGGSGDGNLTRDVLLSVVDLDKLNLDDFTLDELMASPRCDASTALQGVDEIVDLVCRDLASPTWSDLNGGGATGLQECEC